MKKNQVNLEDLELTYINPKGLVKIIKWGKDYKSWPCEKQVEYAEALASAMNDATDRIQQERDALVADIELANRKVANADKAAAIAKQSLIQNITNSNALQQDYIRQIKEQERTIKELELTVSKLQEELEKINA